jgi:probable rRNA maturation factor
MTADVLADLQTIAAAALQRHRLPEAVEIDLTFCDDDFIRGLNREWRQKDAPTDVLSFPQLDSLEELQSAGELLLGDIVISLERAAAQAEELGHSLRREALYLFAHGLLHLLGYDHRDEREKEKMRLVEEDLLAGVGTER